MSASTLTFLFLGGAKRVAIGRMFLQACEARGIGGRIVAYELDSHSAIASIGTVVEGLSWRDAGIYADIDAVVDRYGVDVIIPFVDPAVAIAAEYRRRVGGAVFVPVGDAAVAASMFDKITSAQLFERKGIATPATYRPGDACARLIAKPRFGSASKGIIAIDTLQDLYQVQAAGDKYLIQERIDNKEEISVDCYASVSDGAVTAVSPRLRGEVSGGEAVRTETVDDADAVALAREVIGRIGLRGAVTVQLLRDLDSGRLMVMEVNPRLGGAVVASVHAGVDIPGMIVDEALGKKPVPAVPVPGVETVRYLEDVVFK